MLAADFIRDNADKVKENCRNRGVSEVPVDRVVAFDAERRRLIQLADSAKHGLSKREQSFPALKRYIERKKQEPKGSTFPTFIEWLRSKHPDTTAALAQDGILPADIDAFLEELHTKRDEIAALEGQLKLVEGDLLLNQLQIPNMTHPDAPVGADAGANKVVAEFGARPKFDFTPKDHVALCEALDLADFEAGTKVSGQKFYFLKNEAALLEIALVQYAMQKVVAKGFTPVITPDLARTDVLEGIGFMPRDPNPDTRQVYTVADTDLCLIATAEITLGGMHRDHIFDEADLPRRYVGLSHCFRTEAGAAGRDTRGLYRVHQFTKVEMFAFCTPEQSEAIHQEVRQIEEEIFDGLGLHFHVIDTATGDLGGPAYRKYDLEAWMPGRGTDGDYGEITSTSNCTDFQARRLGVRYKGKGFKGTRFVHTLNGTAVACTRALVALLENGQRADGSVAIPEALRPWVGKDVIAPKT